MLHSHRFVALCAAAVVLIGGCSPADEVSTSGTQTSAAAPCAFDGEAAFRLLEKQVDFGPRVPGTSSHRACAAFIESELRKHADSIEIQPFTVTLAGKPIPMRNIIGWFNADATRWVLLAAHWDTRPTADMEIDALKRARPIPGANDGASGVAVLLELARMFGERRPDVGIVMVFLDGEDYGPGEQAMFLGSKHLAQHLDELKVHGKRAKIDYGILLDMVGDRNLAIYQERNSVEAASDVVDKVWSTAKKLGHEEFRPTVKYAVSDDHLPLIGRGMKCIDIIDFDYAPWHTLDDTPDKCSARSLRIVGEVVAAVIYSER